MRLLAVLLSIILGIVQMALGLRIIGQFFDLAEQGPEIASTIINLTAGIVEPFGRFVSPFNFGEFIIDLPAIIALLVYGVVGALIIRTLRAR